MNTRNTLYPLSLALLASLTGCGESGSGIAPALPTSTAIRADLFTMERPDSVPNLLSVKTTAKEGDEVVFLARVGGRVKPFADSFAMFVVADPSLVSCELMGDEDHCPVPYDYCCEDPKKLTEGMATIQVVDEKGTPLRTSLQGAGGLEGSKFLIVDGVVTEKNDEGLFTVDARKIWVGGKPTRQNPAKGSTPAVPHDHNGDGISDH